MPSFVRLLLASSALSRLVSAVTVHPIFQSTSSSSAVTFGTTTYTPTILVDPNDWAGVIRAAGDLAIDFGRVLGRNGTVSEVVPSNVSWHHYPVIVGTIGKSTLIDSLVASNKISVSSVEGKWESYIQQLVDSPFPGMPSTLVIAGSDKRGTIFGMYDVSEQIGVSPWYWWADAPVPAASTLYLSSSSAKKTQGPPSVKYRGIFLNDEAPCLSGWVTMNYGNVQYGAGYVAAFYEHIFELLLRLKANYLWPAMWGSMFYVDDAQNGPTADMYGIVMGTSHTEPMARATNEEYHFLTGNWDWAGNTANVQTFMEGGVTRAKNWDTLWTMGMRGSGDTASPTLNASTLEQILVWQDNLLNTTFGANTTEQPRLWAIYKEVGGYYQTGMSYPEDITVVWTDDNNGNLLRLPLANETSRPGGAGIYYHFDYVGGPRDYKWINSIQLARTWQQMHLAYEYQADRIWIGNVGDMKALELPLHHFLSMAYDMSQFSSPSGTDNWLNSWAQQNFGSSVSSKTASIMTTYGRLIVRRKYEVLSNLPFMLSTSNYDEAERVLDEWVTLLRHAQAVYDSLPAATQPSFFEMILHPVLAGKTVQEIYIKAALNLKYATQKRTSTNAMAIEVMEAFAQDSNITDQWNALLDGKWYHFMDQVHLGYTSWNDPEYNIPPALSYISDSQVSGVPILGVGIEGTNALSTNTTTWTMIPVDPYMPYGHDRYIDVFTRNNGTTTFKITSNVTYVSFRKSSGTLNSMGKSDIRSVITIDWNAAPSGVSYANITVQGSSNSVNLLLPVHKTSVPSSFSGYIESAGAISIEAEHVASSGTTSSASYKSIRNFGRTLSGMTLWPVTLGSQTTATGPALEYSLYTFTNTNSAQLTFYFGSNMNALTDNPMTFAFSIDGGAASSPVQPVPNTTLGSYPNGWSDAVESDTWTSTVTASIAPGSHTLRVWLLQPGLVLQKLVVNLGGENPSFLGPPESTSQ